MVELTSQTSGKQILRPRARILRTFGDELISSETVAIIELVKNAYDADATRVLVRFSGPIENGQGEIEVIDNGHGMSLNTIQSTWMEPATIFKKRQSRSEKLKRRVLGEKGVGRFAASKLADFLEVVTRRTESDKEIRVFFDWSQFDDEQKYLDQVESLWEVVEPTEICPGGIIQSLWKEDEQPSADELTHGTILRMENLRSAWTDIQFKDLQRRLSRLISPFFGEDEVSRNDTFQVYLDLPDPFESLSGLVRPSDALKKPPYELKGCVDSTGYYNFTFRTANQKDPEQLVGQFLFKDQHIPLCGPFCIEFRVWDRDRPSLEEMARKYSSTLRNIRGDLDDAAGVNIYRDGFRVLPYGEARNDWLRLDYRRFLNPTLRISNNQIVGYVLISADENPELRDQSNREGLIEGPAFDDLRELVIMALATLEEKRYDIRHPRETTQPTEPQSNKKQTQPSAGGLFSNFGLADVHNLVMQRHPEDTALLAFVGEKEKDLERRVEEVQEVLARYRQLATLGQLIDSVLHDGRAPISKINNESYLGQRDIKNADDCNEKLLAQLGKRFGVISNQSEVIATVFRKIEPFGGRKRGRPAQISLEKIIADAFFVLDTEIAQEGVQVSLPETETKVTVDQAEIQEVIINLLQNSLYWLSLVPRSDRKIIVQVDRRGQDEVEILFSDSGPGVKPDSRERIFDPYYSTKPNGIGLGLTIAGEIVSEYYAGKLELVDSDLLPGATFRIILGRRV